MKFTKLLPVALVCFAFLPQLQAQAPVVSPTPDGDYGNGNTAEGFNALGSLTGGQFNTALGWESQMLVTTASFNTGVGAGTLDLTTGRNNTATGAGALLLNGAGFRNTANGSHALLFNNVGLYNCAIGTFAMFNNTDGFSNNAMGDEALVSNVRAAQNTAVGDLALASNNISGNLLGNFNTAVGAESLIANTDGESNDAVGAYALWSNTTGLANQAMGDGALYNLTVGSANVAIGDSALVLLGGAVQSFNTVIGDLAGANLTSGSDNIYIGATSGGAAVESNTLRIGDPFFVGRCFIAGIDTNPTGPLPAVTINPVTHQLGFFASSARFKKDIKPMDKASESIFALKPVTFRYKNNAEGTRQFGLVAEEVAKVNPGLVVLDRDGKPLTVSYEQVNMMLLNEFIKEHRIVEKQQATMASQEAQIKWLTETVKQQATQIQKVSAQVEMIRPAPQVVGNH